MSVQNTILIDIDTLACTENAYKHICKNNGTLKCSGQGQGG